MIDELVRKWKDIIIVYMYVPIPAFFPKCAEEIHDKSQ
jgi:hypothetical protein